MIKVRVEGRVMFIQNASGQMAIVCSSENAANTLHSVLRLTAAPGSVFTVRSSDEGAPPTWPGITAQTHWREGSALRITREEKQLIAIQKFRAHHLRADLNTGDYVLLHTPANRWAYREVATARGESWE